MYEIRFVNSKIQKKINKYIQLRGDISDKLRRLSINPFREIGAHLLRGKLKGKWSCWLGSNIRMIYVVDLDKKIIFVQSVGSHNVY